MREFTHAAGAVSNLVHHPSLFQVLVEQRGTDVAIAMRVTPAAHAIKDLLARRGGLCRTLRDRVGRISDTRRVRRPGDEPCQRQHSKRSPTSAPLLSLR